MKTSAFFCLLMIFLLPFTHAFAVNFVLCLPVVTAILLFVVGTLCVRTTRNPFRTSDLFLLGLWVLLSVSIVFGTMTPTAINHWLAYTTFILVVYFGGGRVIAGLTERNPNFWNRMLTAITFMLLGACAYALVDWLFFLTTGSEIPLPRPEGGGNGSAAGFVRARGFLGEPSGLGNFILMWAPLAIWHIFSIGRSLTFRYLFLAVVIGAFLATFSTKGILTALSSLPVVVGFIALRKGLDLSRIVGILFLCLVGAFVVFVSGLGDVMYEAIAPKFFGSDVYNARFDRGMNVVNYIQGFHWFVGYGPASYVTLVGHDSEQSFLSGFAYLLGDGGLIGVTLFSLFLFSQLLLARKLKDQGLKITFFVTLYYIVVGEIVAPMHYGIGTYFIIILLHVAIQNQSRIFKNAVVSRGMPLPRNWQCMRYSSIQSVKK
ncbi:MAG: hypothetical protein IKM45_02350 [Opitutales bacterium]|nr:hypothetical protein [Opitutales bacterium]